MDNVLDRPTDATDRIVLLATPEFKARLKRSARESRMTVSAFVRSRIEQDDSHEVALLDRAMALIDETTAEVQASTARFDQMFPIAAEERAARDRKRADQDQEIARRLETIIAQQASTAAPV